MNSGSRENGQVELNGAVLRYLCEGTGQPVLVVGSSVYYPRTFADRLRARFRMTFADSRHFADESSSSKPEVLGLGTWISDLEQIREHAGLERFVLIGHSHHGNLALEYAKRHPTQVSHLVLIGTPPVNVDATRDAAKSYWEVHASDIRKQILQERLAAVRNELAPDIEPTLAYISRYVAEAPRYWCDPHYDAGWLWRGVPFNLPAMAAFREFFAGSYALHWDEEELSTPVLVVMGKHDYAVPPTLWDDALPTLNNVTYHVSERSGHTPQLEAPEEFEQLLVTWLAAHG